MFINKKLVFTAAVALVLAGSSCKKYLDVNTDPNVSQTATVQTLLPAAELLVGSSVGVDLQITGSIWSQYWTQTPNASQYVTFEQYAPGQDAFLNSWSNLYSAAENFYQLYNLADTLHKKQYMAISLLMQAYTFQLISDGWGDVPFKQALKGQYDNGHLINPKYDSQLVVYNGILAYIDSANKLINTAATSSTGAPSTDDLIYGGDMVKWQKFSNTLKLKILLRMSAVNPTVAHSKITALFAGSTASTFIGIGDEAKISYGFSSANKSPLYAETSSTALSGIQNLGGSKTCIDSMNSNSDPRAVIFYEPISSGAVVGITQSQYNVTIPSTSYSIPSFYVAGDNTSTNSSKSTNAPVNLLTGWESYFMQAEVAARGWGATSAAEDVLFYDGIKASFGYQFYSDALAAEWGPTAYADYIAGAGYWTVYPTAGTLANRLKFIITQKWFAMCGNQGFEAWSELRRTGYPDFLVHPVNSLIGTNRPYRYMYPTTESSTNANFPTSGVAPLTSKVWWTASTINW